MIQRIAKDKLKDLSSKFKAVAVTGARQTGKTTLVKQVFKGKTYLSLENPDTRNFALEDPRGFLESYPNGAILDEVQRVPHLFSYLQEILDSSKVKGLFILTGSNNFLLQQTISQSLAGRVGYINLLPFSISELKKAKLLTPDDNNLMLKGFYPPIYDQDIPPLDWCPNYIRTYIEKDVRQIKNITDLIVFERFIKLLAGRTGQELNNSALAVETGVDVKTIQSWIGILESSFIIYLLKPHHKNFNKTIVKRPKVYFYDTAIVCYLLGIRNTSQLNTHPLRGAIFEGMVVTELIKKRTNSGLPINLFYWRDKTGHEIDIIVDDMGKLLPIEIKSGKTVNTEFFKNIYYWSKLTDAKKSILLYAGEQNQKRSIGIEILNWRSIITQDF
ncbi:MAG TPA: ATP-binding protein [Flavobacteriales bacterium]|nr:ATP-binding protein [Flavobacteriales bacterium]HRJ38661.1 ATP-binding protein [Flavobacteriales bacterium]